MLLFPFDMKTITLTLALLLASITALADETLVLSVGRSGSWSAPAKIPVSVSDGSVIRVSDEGSSLKIIARKLGTAHIRAGSRTLDVHVLSESDSRLYHKLAGALEGRRGLELTSDGKEIFVRGRLLRFDDWLAISEATEGASSHYVFEARLAPEIQEIAQKHLQRKLTESHLPELALSFQPHAVVTIPAEPQDLKVRCEKALGAFGFRVDVSSTALSLEPLVRVKLLVAEVRKTMWRQIGVKWPTSVQAQLAPQFLLPKDPGFGVDISALEENGLGKILASPTLLCRSGKEAQFLAGGEIPIKIVNYKVHDIVWKKYGVLLKIKPKADFSGRMSIGIETEVSMLDATHKVDGIPGFLTNRIETHFDLASSRTIVLSGLIKKEWDEASSGLPGLSQIPILGALFSSRDYHDNRTELVVFVTPEIARPNEESAP